MQYKFMYTKALTLTLTLICQKKLIIVEKKDLRKANIKGNCESDCYQLIQ